MTPSPPRVSRRRRFLRRALALLALGTVVVLVTSWILAGRLLAPVPASLAVPTDLPVEGVTLESRSGSRLAAWYLPLESASASVVLAHPIRGSRLSMLGRARRLREAGCAVLLFDFQAHGESPGERITLGHLERHDITAAVEFVRARRPEHRIGVIGFSLGGASAVLASPLGIDVLVLESVFPTVEEAIQNRIRPHLRPLATLLAPLLIAQLELRLGIAPANLRPEARIGEVACPVLIAAGDRDERTPLAETERLFAAAREPRALVVFPGLGHVDLFANARERYEREVLPFLLRHLSSPPAATSSQGERVLGR